jgi:hypothetical protein
LIDYPLKIILPASLACPYPRKKLIQKEAKMNFLKRKLNSQIASTFKFAGLMPMLFKPMEGSETTQVAPDEFSFLLNPELPRHIVPCGESWMDGQELSSLESKQYQSNRESCISALGMAPKHYRKA